MADFYNNIIIDDKKFHNEENKKVFFTLYENTIKNSPYFSYNNSYVGNYNKTFEDFCKDIDEIKKKLIIEITYIIKNIFII